ncbi:MAG: flagellar hook protein FlgE [Firmicutes bacterium]|nr:flagellar hook protein FlgE [Candidatus Fermentithermobacillaceae bacterium]
MMRSLFSAVSGLRSHQTRMDVIGNNIANVNTTAFKASRVTFQEIFAQTLRGATAPTAGATGRGGSNPLQVGLGVNLASIDTIHTPGNLQPTGKSTDLAIEGNGFFVVKDGERIVYTRAGNFDRDAWGTLVDSEGRKVLGWAAVNGVLPPDRGAGNLTSITIKVGEMMPASATTTVVWSKNLDAEAPAGTSRTIAVPVYDSLGRVQNLLVTFTKTANPNEWQWSCDWDQPPSQNIGSGTIQFDTSGAVSGGGIATLNPFTPPGAATMTLTFDFNGLTQVAGPTTAEPSEVDGSSTGTLESFAFDTNGVISGFYSNGRSRILGQIALADFDNPGGLQKVGKNLFVESNNSGKAKIGAPDTGGRGRIAPSALEMSNVDLAEEFTQMIITQRGFQANSRIITVSDEMLQELVNLKR